MSNRQVTQVKAQVEYRPAPWRNVTQVKAQVEYRPAPWRNVTQAKAMIELTEAEYTEKPGKNPNPSKSDCPYASTGNEFSKNPIGLLDGDVMAEGTDLVVFTPAGQMAFSRTYLQSRRSDFQHMGLGWTHNHAYTLTKITGTPNRIEVNLGNAGKAYYTEISTNHYEGVAGVGTVIDWNSGTSQYTLTGTDKSKLIFDSDGKLLSRVFANGEAWTYCYNPDLDPEDEEYPEGCETGNLLRWVTDAYGRGLQFSYINPSTADHKLWRVGDHNATGLDGESPNGRYVEFSYITEKLAGDEPESPKALLASVRDVRSTDEVDILWSYDYYGQHMEETVAEKQNFLTKRISPEVDVTGEGTTFSPIVLEELEYTLSGGDIAEIVQERGDGLLETTFGFDPENRLYTSQEVAGKTSFQHFLGGVRIGTEDPAGNVVAQSINYQYRPDAQADGNGNTTHLDWNSKGTILNGVTDALGNPTRFIYYKNGPLADALYQSIDAQNHKTLYFYEDSVNPRLPTLILVTNGNDLVIDGSMENIDSWLSIVGDEPDINLRSATQVDTGSYARRVVASDADQGIESNAFNLVADIVYLVTARVYLVSGTVRMQVTGTSSFDASVSETGAWQTLRIAYKPTSPATGVKLQFIADGGAAEFYVDTVSVVDTPALLRWQEFSYDSLGRTLSEQTLDVATGDPDHPLQHTTREYWELGQGNDEGVGLLKSVTQMDIGGSDDITTTYMYDEVGRIVQVNQSSTFGNCQHSYTVYDKAGNVVASVCNYDPDLRPDPENTPAIPTTAEEATDLFNEAYPDFNRVTVYQYDNLGRRIAITTNAGADYAQTTLTVYDSLDRVVRTIANYVQAEAVPDPYVADHDAFDHGTDNTQNLVTDTAYNARGMVRKQVDVLGNVMLFGYDDADRLIKTVWNASDPDYNNDYVGISSDPALSAYNESTDTDKDIITTQDYDAAGNLVKTVDALGNASFTIYDVLNRPVKTVRSAKSTATVSLQPGDEGYEPANDPRLDENEGEFLAGYKVSELPDRDIIAKTEYDSLGRVIRTEQLLDARPAGQLQWVTTLYGYDELGRQIKVIRNASNPDYDLSTDPDLSDYVIQSNADLDIVANTVYDAAGRVLYTEDVNGTKTWFVYDGLGRQVKTVLGYEDQGEVPDVWVWNDTEQHWQKSTGTNISHGTYNDQNIISATQFDENGRVPQTQDVLGRITRYVYDTLGRVVRTVTNFVEQGEDPAMWEWHDGWTLSDDITPVDHGTDNDQNIVSSTIYDAQGRVSQTIDHLNNVTQFVYDILGRRITAIVNYIPQGESDPADWAWDATTDNRWEDGADNAIDFGTDNDQNRISTSTYDVAGHVLSTRDAAGILTVYDYDAAGRQIQVIANYVSGASTAADEDLISTMAYNKAGQIVLTTDARNTQTAFTYDTAGRRLAVTQAANNPLATTSYVCYDKVGRVLRTIAAYHANDLSPDEQDENGNWLFNPDVHGGNNDVNLITNYTYDQAGRRLSLVDTEGNVSGTAYYKDGQVEANTDPMGVVTKHRYDKLRRRIRVIAGYTPGNFTDPGNWQWDDRWEDGLGQPIAFGDNNDQNIITQVMYDTVGQVLNMRDPNGNQTSYDYDFLNRRKSLTNPLLKTWETVYETLSNGHRRTVLTDPNTVETQQEFDRLGRLLSIQYGDPTNTADVKFIYDNVGNRTKMSEYSNTGFTSLLRETSYGYDAAHRLTEVGFDNDGNSVIDQTVTYEYNKGGLRTKLILPGSLEITYNYDVRGNLVARNDWDDNLTSYGYDALGRLGNVERDNGLRCHYVYDGANRLRTMRHTKGSNTFAHLAYQLDARGNRTQAYELLIQPATTDDVTIAFDSDELLLKGTWILNEVDGFRETTDFSASLKFAFFGDEATLTMGVGNDHSIYDIYINGSLWQSFNGYAASPDEINILITAGVDGRKLQNQGPHIIEIRNRVERDVRSSGYKLRFKQLVVEDIAYIQHTIGYDYDNLSRLLEARYNPGVNTAATETQLEQHYLYSYDVAGNRLSQSVADNGGTPVVTGYDYNEGNQLISDGTNSYQYDDNGNLVNVNNALTPVYEWDRANRLTAVNGPANIAYQYNGLGQRVQQTADSIVTQYLLDTQPGLYQVLAATEDGTDTTRYIHGQMGLEVQVNPGGMAADRRYPIVDALGSVRSVVNNALDILETRLYAPFGEQFSPTGSPQTIFGFTGEEIDPSTGLVNLRIRPYSPILAVFPTLDPFEGDWTNPMSLNRYSYVQGNPINWTDSTGLCPSLSSYPGLLGYRCIWLAEQLHNRYGIPLEVLLSKGYSELETISLLGTLNDAAIIPQALFANPQALAQAFQEVPFLGGYIEGLSGGGGVYVQAGVGGVEVVYNFQTFQRMLYVYTGNGPAVILGGSVNGSIYVGHAEGFSPNTKGSLNFEQFSSDYSGPFNFTQGGAGVQLPGKVLSLTGGVVHFHSPSGQGNIYGNDFYISLGAGATVNPLPATIDAFGGTAWYRALSQFNRPYIRKCKVDIKKLTDDIKGGSGSPHFINVNIGIVSPIRNIAANAAERAATQYNATHPDCCEDIPSTRTPV